MATPAMRIARRASASTTRFRPVQIRGFTFTSSTVSGGMKWSK
jgi:hypothetical protein